MLDALAYGPEVWMPGLSKNDMEHNKAAEKRIIESRDIQTGYSPIEYEEAL